MADVANILQYKWNTAHTDNREYIIPYKNNNANNSLFHYKNTAHLLHMGQKHNKKCSTSFLLNWYCIKIYTELKNIPCLVLSFRHCKQKYIFLNLHIITMLHKDKIFLFPIGIWESGGGKIILISNEKITVMKFTSSYKHQRFTKSSHRTLSWAK